MALFLLASGIFFWNDFQPGQLVGMRHVFDWMVWILVFITPGARSQEMFAELAELTRVHGTRLDPAVVGAVAREYGISVGPPT